mmetsp:Transcript_13391/g.53743  ORF Transcript_13391/g.53743 Transcript_13391/m.53743 type:complete len:222 (+) Transcript_13391:996-1661(+)
MRFTSRNSSLTRVMSTIDATRRRDANRRNRLPLGRRDSDAALGRSPWSSVGGVAAVAAAVSFCSAGGGSLLRFLASSSSSAPAKKNSRDTKGMRRSRGLLAKFSSRKTADRLRPLLRLRRHDVSDDDDESSDEGRSTEVSPSAVLPRRLKNRRRLSARANTPPDDDDDSIAWRSLRCEALRLSCVSTALTCWRMRNFNTSRTETLWTSRVVTDAAKAKYEP